MNSRHFKDWQEISKEKAFIITLLIISFYAYWHWQIIKESYWDTYLTFAFALGIGFGFLANIKPGTNDVLVFNHKELSTVWSDGLCLVPSLFPFLHRIDIRLLWSLFNLHHKETVAEEKAPYINHDVKINSGNITQTKTEVDFWTLKYWEMFSVIVNWFFSKHKNPVFVYQDFGFKIILLVFVLDALSLTANLIIPRIETMRPTAGQCINIPEDETARISMKSMPISLFGIYEDVKMISPIQESFTWTELQTALLPNQIFEEEIVFEVKSNNNYGQICF